MGKHELRDADSALLDRVKSGKLDNLDAGEVQRLAELRRLGFVEVERGSGDKPDKWSLVGAPAKRARSGGK